MSIDELIKLLGSFILPQKDYFVAYSGGVDSHVLLDILATHHNSKNQIHAIHINHHLSPNANTWEKHCFSICHSYGVSFEVENLDLSHLAGESLESLARDKRYEALQKMINERGDLLTAHHQQDQAETVLLQLLRGAGIKGLCAMPSEMPFGEGKLIRPFLNVTKDDILHYAKQKKLTWVEDESNQNSRFSRNYLRHYVMPNLISRWPETSANIARSAKHLSNTKKIIDEINQKDFKVIKQVDFSISLDKLNQFSKERQQELIRYWLSELDLPVPSTKQLSQVFNDVINAKQDANPCCQWPGAEVRRFKQKLYAMLPLTPLPNALSIAWSWPDDCLLPALLGVVRSEQVVGLGIRSHFLNQAQNLQIRFRQQNEYFHPAGRQHSQSLKKLLQEWEIPTWLRDRIPLLYADDKLISVIGYGIRQDVQVDEDEIGWRIYLDNDQAIE